MQISKTVSATGALLGLAVNGRIIKRNSPVWNAYVKASAKPQPTCCVPPAKPKVSANQQRQVDYLMAESKKPTVPGPQVVGRAFKAPDVFAIPGQVQQTETVAVPIVANRSPGPPKMLQTWDLDAIEAKKRAQQMTG